METYEIELQQLKKALKRSDQYIEKITLEIDTYKQQQQYSSSSTITTQQHHHRNLISPAYGIQQISSGSGVSDKNTEVTNGSSITGTTDLYPGISKNSSLKPSTISNSRLQGHGQQYHPQQHNHHDTPSNHHNHQHSASATLQSLVRQSGAISSHSPDNVSSYNNHQRRDCITKHQNNLGDEIWNPSNHHHHQQSSPPRLSLLTSSASSKKNYINNSHVTGNSDMGNITSQQQHQYQKNSKHEENARPVMNNDGEAVDEGNTVADQTVISNPHRFPACIKLLELSKQHDTTTTTPPPPESLSSTTTVIVSSPPSSHKLVTKSPQRVISRSPRKSTSSSSPLSSSSLSPQQQNTHNNNNNNNNNDDAMCTKSPKSPVLQISKHGDNCGNVPSPSSSNAQNTNIGGAIFVKSTAASLSPSSTAVVSSTSSLEQEEHQEQSSYNNDSNHSNNASIDGDTNDEITIVMPSEEQPLEAQSTWPHHLATTSPTTTTTAINNNEESSTTSHPQRFISNNQQQTSINKIVPSSWSKSLSSPVNDAQRYYNHNLENNKNNSRSSSPYYALSPSYINASSPPFPPTSSRDSRESPRHHHGFLPPLKKIKTEILYE